MTSNEQLLEQRLRRCSANPRDNDIRFDRSLYVSELQTYLRALEPDEAFLIVPDGIFGDETTIAVKRFQKSVALEENGIVDFITWTQIVDAYAAIDNHQGK